MVSNVAADIISYGVWVVSISFVACAVVLDFSHNPTGHKRSFVHFRLLNWFLIGFSYALTYFARYNVNVINVPSVRDEMGVSASEFGWIITVGFWGYAVFVIINGMMVDKLGARKSVLLGSVGSGCINIILGFFFAFSHARGIGSVAVVCWLCAVNNYAQTYSTAAICKAGVNWYPMKERGFFSGIFGVIIAFGFFLAFQVNGTIYSHFHYSWVFFIPGIAELVAACVCFFVIRSTPWDAGFTLKHMGDPVPPPAGAKTPSLWTLIRTVFLKPIFLLFCVAEICIGWCRDGMLSWFSDYLEKVYGVKAGSACFSLAAGGITIGGMFGSLSAGIASDLLFDSRRTPVAFLYCCGLFVMLVGLFFFKNQWLSALLIGACSLFFSGAHGIVTSTCAMDFAGSEATGTAVGMLDGIQKMASSATGALMGVIIEQGHQWWIFSMMPAAVLAASMFLIVIGKRGKTEKAGDKGGSGSMKTDVDEDEDDEKRPLLQEGSIEEDGVDELERKAVNFEEGEVEQGASCAVNNSLCGIGRI